MKKLLIALLALLLCALPSLTEDEPERLTDGAYEYYLTEEGAVLTRYTAPTPSPVEVVLPLEIGGTPIVRYEFVFHDPENTGPLRVIVPEGVTRIEEWAFYLVPLTRVEIPASCTFVEYMAFDPEVEQVLLGSNTHLETEEEYNLRMGWDD